jgi:hypothetical protein
VSYCRYGSMSDVYLFGSKYALELHCCLEEGRGMRYFAVLHRSVAR